MLTDGVTGDMVTSVAGLNNRSSSYRFSSQIRSITDVTIVYTFSSQHVFKPNSLVDAEKLKNVSFQSDYNQLVIAFAPFACKLQLLWSAGP